MPVSNVIPVDPVKPFWTQTTTLDGVPYLLTFRYNSRESVYYLTIASADGVTTHAQGIKIVPGLFLLTTYATPPGELMVVTKSAQDDSPPRLGELADGGRCALLYLNAADLFAPGNTADLERFPGFIV